MKTNYYSIIDIGSNTMRLVIYAQGKSLRLQEVENVKSVARLRNYLDENGKLSTDGIKKMMDTLQSFQKVMETYDLAEFACVATATVRQAKNKKDISKKVKAELGWNLRILSDYEEAFYGYLAVVNSTTIKEGITVDIGGGSTEVTYFKDRRLVKSHSFPFGGLTLQKYFMNEKSRDKQMEDLQVFLKREFHTLDWITESTVPLVAIGGSARNLAQVHQGLIDYPLAGLHQYLMTEEDIEITCKYMSGFSENELGKIEGLSGDRADTILPATIVFLTLSQTIHSDGLILSRKGLRDGIFYERLAIDSDVGLYPNVLEDSVLELVYEYNLNRKQIDKVLTLAEKLLNFFIKKDIGTFEQLDWINLERGCYVYNLGNYIDSESSSQHTFYLLANRTIDGLMHMERLEMALIGSFKNRTIFKQYMEPFKNWFTKKEEEKLAALGALLKFVYCFDTSKRQVVEDISLSLTGDTIHMKIHCNEDHMPESYQAQKQKKHLEKVIDQPIELEFVYN